MRSRTRPTLVLVALFVLPALLFAQGASASLGSTRITSPTDGSYFLENAAEPGAEVTISGTTEGKGEMEIRCYSGAGTYTEVAEVEEEEIKAKKFSVSVPISELGEEPCVLRAVPTGETAALAPGTSTPYEGPSVAYSQFSSISDETDKVQTDFAAEARTLESVYEIDSAGTCGLGPTALIEATSLVESAELFRCAGALTTPPAEASRAAIQVDGLNAYVPYAADAIWKSLTPRPSNDPPASSVTKTFTSTEGLKTVHETEPLVECSGTVHAYPETTESCKKFISAGVSLERTWSASDGGRLISMKDEWHSTDGAAHTVSTLYSQELASDATNAGTFEFPGGAPGFATTKTGATLSLTASEGAILYREDAAAEEVPGAIHPVGAIVLGTSPSGPVQVTAGSSDTAGSAKLQLPFSFSVPAAGTHTLTMAYADGYTLPEVCREAEEAKSGCQPSVAIASPSSGTSTGSSKITVSGTAGDLVELSSLTVDGQHVTVTGGAWTTSVALTPGANTITAVATNHAGLTRSATTSVTYTTAEKLATTTTLSSSLKPATVGAPVTYTAEVIPTSATGTVDFKDAGTTITGCGAQTITAGEARCLLAGGYAVAGSHSITAVYSGDGNYKTSTSATLTQIVEAELAGSTPTPETHPEAAPPVETPKASTTTSTPTASAAGAAKVIQGKVEIVLTCAGAAGTSCTVKATLTTVETLRGAHPAALGLKSGAHTRTVVVGSGALTIPAGTSRTLTVALNAGGRALLSRFHRLPLHLGVLQQDMTTGHAGILAQNLSLALKHR